MGSGPAGLACAQQLARAGHDVHVFEKHAKAGGLLRYGIPDFKMEKHLVERRVDQMAAEGVVFHYGAHIGVNVAADKLLADYDAVVLTGGAEKGRELPIPGRELKGIHFAMEFLPQQNRRVSNEPQGDVAPILAGGKHVVVIGGGDTGSDCIGTSIRQGARSVTNFEIMPQPPEHENKPMTWPDWPLKLRTSSSHEEGAKRHFAVMTQKFSGANGQVQKLHCVHVDERMKPVAGSEFELDADLVLLAMGFVHPVHEGLLEQLALGLDPRGNVKADTLSYQSSNPESVRSRRHAPRPVPGGLGDPRRPPGRACGGQVPDGSDDVAEVAGVDSPDGAQRNPGPAFPHCAALHASYTLFAHSLFALIRPLRIRQRRQPQRRGAGKRQQHALAGRGMQPVLRRLAGDLGPERIRHDEAGILRKNVARDRKRGGEEQPVAVQPIVHPFLVGAKIRDR